jgi:hypothetical protein
MFWSLRRGRPRSKESDFMPKKKPLAKKLRLIAAAKKKPAPRWADLKKHGKRARTRRIPVHATKPWRRGRLKK